ncbi:MAG TPA: hypothetical protein VFD08_03965 [Clostridia bacterium]|nr:hypothetical protein [Clostridia bacterium]
MNLMNKKFLAAFAFIFLALVFLFWPETKGPKEPLDINVAEVEQGKAEEETLITEKEEQIEKISGSYGGQVNVDSIELVGKNIFYKVPVALAKNELEEQLAEGFYVNLIITEDGAWTLDLGDTFAQYQITTIGSTQEDRIDMEEGSFEAERGFFVPDLDDNIYLTLRGHVLDSVQGTILLEGDTPNIKLSFLGSFNLIKEEE